MNPSLPPASAALLPPISCLQDGDRPWLPMDARLPGLAIKYLHINVADDEMTVLLKMPVGLALPRHRHDGAVFVYTLQGEWRYREYDWIARPGSTVLEPAGSHHTPEAIASETGEVVTFNVMRGDLVLLDEAGNETARENGRVALLRERKFARATPDVAPPFVTR
ncbi:2,4-dihydroxyacetophenone dioxygenase [Burkholderia mayonis]|uniref:2,4-dihydroxyacetophenone dioxygenase n=1 Tax=Burkholderia mayonis TaxID=1385591 RepID=A0A1B4FKY4_9BURK|nr:2,4'-dihydroxyacetophenone dioxygenase family protein [Burkholderia mayonis]AOJ04338.1 2,4-dihydroxyacetophenone dioxygenase [Burkholderia mayonis]KVE49660.1 2,4-dihydroxyacetophenone dioxygenase [Burkholderia mayonis]